MPIKALILVDIQNDFLPSGALGIKDSNAILPHVKALLSLPFDLIAATKDQHPKDHISFAATHNKTPGETLIIGNKEQILWPVHCVQGSEGAEFPAMLDSKKIDKVFYKGTHKLIDSYSAFFDNERNKSTGLAEYLISKNAREIYIAGLATDYCVKYSVIDALSLHFKVFVISDACRGIDLHPNDCNRALQEMEQAGAVLTTFEEIVKSLLNRVF